MLVFISALGCGNCGDDVDPNPSDGGNVSDTQTDDFNTTDAGSDAENDRGRPRPDVSFDFPDPPDFGPVVFRVDTVVPPTGPVTGGTQVVVSGSGFSRETVVYFGSRRADLQLVGGNLVGLTPAGAGTGPVNVKLLDPNFGNTEVLENGYTYTEQVIIDSIVPSRIPTTGGVEVTITGRGFDPDTRVSFGGQTGLRHTIADGTVMRVVTPPNVAGPTDVRASSPIGSVTVPDGVTYFQPLEIRSVNPATGPPAGGNTVTIEGAGFVPGMMFEFDGVPATSVAVNAQGQNAIVTVPAHAAGLVYVRAETPNGDAVVKPNAYFYAAPGTFAAVANTPNVGPTSGGTAVTIVGAGLNALNLTVTIGGNLATIVSQQAGEVVVTTPAGALGTVDIVVDNSSQIATIANGFTYVDDLQISNVAPATGDVAGGDAVVLTGIGFTNTTAVTFGGLAAGFTVDSDTQITATSPAHSAGLVDVTVKRADIDATRADAFTFTEALEIYGYFPVKGSIAGNTYVEIRGRGFTGNIGTTFDLIPSPDVTILDAQTIAVRSPEHPVGVAPVEVSRGQESALAPFPFTYFDPGSRFGGAWGDPIQGAVNVTVYSTGGTPIENAFVMLSTNAQTPYQGQTNAMGLVTLSGPDVYGEQTITAVAAGFSSTSVQRVDAENITIFLSPPPEMGPPPPGTPPAIFTGFISGLDKLAEPGPDEFQMAIVNTTQIDPFTPNPPAGDGNIVLTNGTYTLQSRFGDLAVVAVGGLYDNTTQTFKPLRMGIARFQFASSGETYNVDIDLDIPLETVLTFKLNNVPNIPTAPTQNQVVPWLDLGFEGVHGGIDVATGVTDIIQATRQAPLTGTLADARYFAIGGAYGPGGLPQTVGLLRNITQTSTIQVMPGLVGIANLTSPANGTFPVDRLFEFDLNADEAPDFFYVIIQTPLGVPVWNVFLPGTERSFRLPDFPDFSFLPPEERPVPYPGGQYLVDIIGFRRPGFVYSNVSYNDLGIGDVTAYSYSRTLVQF